jgi:hypothetical protein
LKHAVAVAHAAIVADDGREHELVAEIMRVGVRDHGAGVGKTRRLGLDDRRIGLGDALPALVAVHRIIAAAHSRDRHGGRQRRGEAPDVLAGRSRRRVAAVREGMHHRRHAGLRQDDGERRRMVLVRVNAAG